MAGRWQSPQMPAHYAKAELAEEIEVTREHLSRVLNRQRPLSGDLGRRLSGVLGVSWDVIQKPELVHQTDLINLSLVGFLHEPGALNWTKAIRLASQDGYSQTWNGRQQ